MLIRKYLIDSIHRPHASIDPWMRRQLREQAGVHRVHYASGRVRAAGTDACHSGNDQVCGR